MNVSSQGEIKIVILGDTMVGKTSLLTRWIEERVMRDPSPTLGAAYKSTDFNYEGNLYKINFWDTAGQETYRSTMPLYCRCASAGIIVFDLTNRDTFQNIESWIKILRETTTDSTPFVILGNKADIASSSDQTKMSGKGKLESTSIQREVSFEEALDLAQKYTCINFETSALTGKSVEEAFQCASRIAIENVNASMSSEMDTTPNIDLTFKDPPKGEKCC